MYFSFLFKFFLSTIQMTVSDRKGLPAKPEPAHRTLTLCLDLIYDLLAELYLFYISHKVFLSVLKPQIPIYPIPQT